MPLTWRALVNECPQLPGDEQAGGVSCERGRAAGRGGARPGEGVRGRRQVAPRLRKDGAAPALPAWKIVELVVYEGPDDAGHGNDDHVDLRRGFRPQVRGAPSRWRQQRTPTRTREQGSVVRGGEEGRPEWIGSREDEERAGRVRGQIRSRNSAATTEGEEGATRDETRHEGRKGDKRHGLCSHPFVRCSSTTGGKGP